MPYPRGPAKVTQQAYNNEVTALLPTGVDAPAAGDLILILINGARSIPAIVEYGTSAYTIRNAASIGGTARLAFAYKIAAGGDANPTFRANDGSSCEWSTEVVLIRDFDTTTPIDVSGTGYLFGTFTAMPCTFGASLSAATDNMMVVYALGIHEGTMTVTGPLDGLKELGKTFGGNDQGPLVVGYRTKVTAGPCVNETFYSDSTDGGTSVVITIKNSSGGKSEPDVKIDASFVNAANQFPNFYGNIGAQNGAAITWKDPADLLTGAAKSTIDGIGLHTVDPTITTSEVGYLYQWGKYTTIENSSNLSPSSLWTGGGHDFTSTVNMSGKVFSLMWYSTLGNANPNQPNTDGVCVVFKDNQGTPAWVAYQLQPLVTLLATTDFQSLIACGSSAATPLDSSGTMDWTNVKGIGFFMHRKTGSAVAWALGIKNAVLLDKATILGGSAAYPASFTDLKPALDSWNHFGLVDRQASAQMQLLFDTQIGNGTDVTYFDSSAQSAEYPATYLSPTTALTQNKWNGLGGTQELSIYPSASDTVNLTATGLVTQTEQAFTINASSSASATVSFAGTSIVGWNPTWKTGIPCSNVTFKRCAMIDFKAADLVNVIANTGTDTALMSASNGFSATGCTFTASATAVYGIRIAAAGTFDLASTTFSGFTKDIDVTATTGTVTINLAAGQSTPTYQTAGATVVLSTPPATVSATVAANTRVLLYNVTRAAEIDNTFITGTAYSYGITTEAGSGDTLDLFYFKEGYKEGRTRFTWGASDVTVAIEQSVDAVVTAFRTEDSITDYTTLTEFSIYSPTIYIRSNDADGTSKISRLATFYNGVLTTADGASYFRGGMTMLSTGAVRVNKSVVALLLENVSSTHSLRFSDEATRRLSTDDGTSIIAPSSQPYSIEYAYGGVPDVVAVGSAVLASDIVDIADAVWAKTLP